MQRKSSSQVTGAYNSIRDQIITYALSPDTLLSDNQLAKALGMSRAPIREAILLLERDGLVQISEDGKVRVSPVSFTDICDIFSVRFALESESIRLIAMSGWLNKKQISELKSIHKNLKKFANSLDVSHLYEYDDLFHQKLASYSNSIRISDILDRLSLQMQRVRWLNVTNPNRHLSSVTEHEKLLDAIIACNKEAAINLLRLHFENSKNTLNDVLNDKKLQALSLAINIFTSKSSN